MNVSETNLKAARIAIVQNELNSVQLELKKARNISNVAFSCKDNWRAKQSFEKKIPILEKRCDNLIKEIQTLKKEISE